MVRVIDDLKNEDYEELFHLDDIEKIKAIKFEGAFSHDDILNIISNLEEYSHHIVREEVRLYDERPLGTHAYRIYLLDGSDVNIPIWWENNFINSKKVCK